MTRTQRRSIRTVLALYFSTAGFSYAQYNHAYQSQSATLRIDSGPLSAATSGQNPVLLFSQNVEIPGVAWLRLHFSEVTLSGSRSAGNASFVRFTGTEPSAVQSMDSVEFRQWGNSTALFKGNSILVEMFSYPGTGLNRIAMDLATFEDAPLGSVELGICGDADGRVPSADQRVGRIRFKKFNIHCETGPDNFCTAFAVDGRPNVFLTAGHCCEFFPATWCLPPILEFNVPLSEDGVGMPPSPMDQFVVDHVHSVEHFADLSGTGYVDGEDWCVFGVWPNAENEHYPIQQYHTTFQELSENVPDPDGKAARIVGYGVDIDPQYSRTQGADSGPHVDTDGHIIRIAIDARPENSGSPVYHVCGEVYAIFTDGRCPQSPNLGTAVDHPLLVDALTPNIVDAGTLEPKGVAADCNNNNVKDWCDVDCRGTGSACDVPGCGQRDDCNANDVPDECESTRDCNNNSIRDICEVYSNPLLDCNKNGVPDGCDLTRICLGDFDHGETCTSDAQCNSGTCRSHSLDCNANAIPDECDICAGTVQDCNLNFVPDACDISSGTSCDGQYDGVPDECQPPLFGKGACCLSSASGDCTDLTRCQCEQEGMWFFGVGKKCRLVDCETAPQP